MACSITIASVSAIDTLSNPPTGLHIEGTAVDCKKITVSVVCNVAGVPDLADVEVESTGEWSVDLAIAINSLCNCGQSVTVHAECIADPTCTADELLVIDCPEACPVISDLDVSAATSCGTRTVTFTVTITDASGSGSVASWEYETGIF